MACSNQPIPDLNSTVTADPRRGAPRALAGAYLFVLGFLLFGTYPLGWVPNVSFLFEVSFASAFVLALLAVPVLLAFRWRLRPALLVPVVAYLVGLGYSFWRHPQDAVAAGELLGNVSIPLIAAVIAVSTTLITSARLHRAGFAVWLVQIVYGVAAVVLREEPVGLAGNRNWLASLLLALLPSAWCTTNELLRRYLRRRGGRYLVVGLLTLIPTLDLVYRCESRGAWLALIGAGLWLLGERLRGLERALFIGLLVVAVVTAQVILVRFHPGLLVRTVAADVRIPLWGRTMALIGDHWGGVGPGQFRRAFTPYRANSRYHRRAVAAAVTIHPHNEPLNIAAQAGLLPGLAWLVLLVPLLWRPHDAGGLAAAARFPALVIVLHSFFDLTLVRPPGNLIALFCLGLCWLPWVSAVPLPSAPAKPPAARPLVAAAVLLLVLLAVLTTQISGLRNGVDRRRAGIAEEYGRAYRDRADHLARADRAGVEQALATEARRYFDEAFQAYREVVRRDPRQIHAAYEAGRIALLDLQRPDDALPLLGYVQHLDPNYVHLNRFLCEFSMTRGALPAALGYAMTERWLYPFSPGALQLLYACQVLAGKLDRAAQSHRDLARLYREKAETTLTTSDLPARQEAWERDLAASQREPALALATRLCEPLETTAADPVLLFLDAKPGGTIRALAEPFQPWDYDYWRSQLGLRQILRTALARAPEKPPLTALFDFFVGKVKVTPERQGYQPPATVWQQRAGSSLAVYCFFAELVALLPTEDTAASPPADRGPPQGGLSFIIHRNERGLPAAATIAADHVFYRLCLDPPALTVRWRADDGPPPPIPFGDGTSQLFFPLASCFAKNQAVAGVLGPDTPHDRLFPAEPPSLQLLRARERAGVAVLPFARLSQFVVTEHLRQLPWWPGTVVSGAGPTPSGQ